MEFNIVYFAFVGQSYGGVEQKIISQFDALFLVHKNVHLYLVSTSAPKEDLSKEISYRQNITSLLNSAELRSNSLRRRSEKFHLIESILKQYDPTNTICYFRFPGADFLFYRFLRRNDKYFFVTEHQEIENKIRIGIFQGNLINDFSDLIYGKKVRRLIRGFVGVSSQYLQNQMSYLSKKEISLKSFFVNGNGIKTVAVKCRKLIPKSKNKVDLLFIGSVYKSHGLHRLVGSMINYYSQQTETEIILHIVGCNRRDTYLTKYLNNPLIQNKVKFYGYLPSNEINDLADLCDISVNSLGLHRIGLFITSTLKSREYCARGIPFITSSFDDDFKDDWPYIYHVAANENLFDLQGIIDFVFRIRKDTDHSTKMRNYCEENLDWDIKMKRLVIFLNSAITNE